MEISDETFRGANTKRYPMATYYRLLLAELLPDLNRIIYIDGDTLVYQDLTEMFNLVMGDNIVLGFVDGCLIIGCVVTNDELIKGIFFGAAVIVSIWLLIKMIIDIIHRGY